MHAVDDIIGSIRNEGRCSCRSRGSYLKIPPFKGRSLQGLASRLFDVRTMGKECSWRASIVIRLNLIVEGQTEEAFVNEVLREHLGMLNIVCSARSVYTSKKGARWYRGGVTQYERIRKDIQNWINQEKSATGIYFSTMFDLYALPSDFPNLETTRQLANPYERIAKIERAFTESVSSNRFIPYVQLPLLSKLDLVHLG